MKARPILFSGEMVRALLEGRKTQTRRVVKPEHIKKLGTCKICNAWRLLWNMGWLNSPYGQPGDLLWVRETWRLGGIYADDVLSNHSEDLKRDCLYYRADCDDGVDRWKPSIYMPRWASRLTLELKDVRVERVHDIEEQDALSEGVTPDDDPRWNPVQAFEYLWDSINSKRGYGWESNPWVWILVFKVHRMNVDEYLK